MRRVPRRERPAPSATTTTTSSSSTTHKTKKRVRTLKKKDSTSTSTSAAADVASNSNAVDDPMVAAALASATSNAEDSARRDSLMEFGFVELPEEKEKEKEKEKDAAPGTPAPAPAAGSRRGSRASGLSSKARSSSLRHVAASNSAATSPLLVAATTAAAAAAAAAGSSAPSTPVGSHHGSHRRHTSKTDEAATAATAAAAAATVAAPADEETHESSTSEKSPATTLKPKRTSPSHKHHDSKKHDNDEEDDDASSKKKDSATTTPESSSGSAVAIVGSRHRRNAARRATTIGLNVQHHDDSGSSTPLHHSGDRAALSASAVAVLSPRTAEIVNAEAKLKQAQDKLESAQAMRSSIEAQLESHRAMLKTKKLAASEKSRVDAMLNNMSGELDALLLDIIQFKKDVDTSEVTLTRARARARRTGGAGTPASKSGTSTPTTSAPPTAADDVRQSILSGAEERAAARRNRKLEAHSRSKSLYNTRRVSEDDSGLSKGSSSRKSKQRNGAEWRSVPSSPISAEKAAANAAAAAATTGTGLQKASSSSKKSKKESSSSSSKDAKSSGAAAAAAVPAKSPDPSPRWQPGQRISMSLFIGKVDGDGEVGTTIYRVGDEKRKPSSANSSDTSTAAAAGEDSSSDEDKRRAPEVKFSAAPEVPMTPRAMARQEAQLSAPPPPLAPEFSLNALLTAEAQEQASKRAAIHASKSGPIAAPALAAVQLPTAASGATEDAAKSRHSRVLSVMFDKAASEGGGEPVQVCSICEDDARWPASVKCHQCQLFYCSECVKFAHPERGLLKHHVLLPVSNEPPPPPPSVDVPEDAPPIVDEPPPIADLSTSPAAVVAPVASVVEVVPPPAVVPELVPPVVATPPTPVVDVVAAVVAPPSQAIVASPSRVAQMAAVGALGAADTADDELGSCESQDAEQPQPQPQHHQQQRSPPVVQEEQPVQQQQQHLPTVSAQTSAATLESLPSNKSLNAAADESESVTGEMDVAGEGIMVRYDHTITLEDGVASADDVDGARAAWLYAVCSIDEADGESLWITGSSARLGEFDESRAVRMRRGERADAWQFCLHTGREPVSTSEPLQYRLLVLGPQLAAAGQAAAATRADSSAVRRRSALRAVQVDGGAALRVHDEWPGESPESTYLANSLFRRVWCRRSKSTASSPAPVKRSGDGAASFEFRVLCTTVPTECSLWVVGSLAELGADDERGAVRLSDAQFPIWSARVACPSAWPSEQTELCAFSYRYFYARADSAGRPVLAGGAGAVVRETGAVRRYAARRALTTTAVANECAVLFDGDFRRAPALRSAVLAVSVASLRSEQSLGVGDFHDLRLLVDWAAKSGIGALTLYPVLDTSVSAVSATSDNDPFAPITGFALHPLYLSVPQCVPPELPELLEECDILRQELRGLADMQTSVSGPSFDYELVLLRKLAMLREVFEETRDDVMRKRDFQAFVRRTSEWLAPYALFCALRDAHGSGEFAQWPEEVRRVTPDDVDRLTAPGSEHFDAVAFYCYLQFNLDAQLRELRRYAEQRGVALIGSMPVNVRNASADVWLAPAQFADAPAQAAYAPSPRSPLGRNLSHGGLAVPRWAAMRADGYAWWRRRLRHQSSYFHGVRLAHPVDFVRVWRIDNDEQVGVASADESSAAAFGHFSPADALSESDFVAAGLGAKREELSLGDNASLFVHDVDFRRWQASLTPEDAAAAEEQRAPDRPIYHPRPAYQSLPGFAKLSPAERHAVEVLARTYEQRNALEWRAAASERLPKVLDYCDMLVLADADKAHVPMPLRQTLDALGVLLVREAERASAAVAGFTPRGSRVGPSRSSYVGAVSTGGLERHSARSWWAAERIAAERLYRALGHKPSEPVPTELPRDAALAMLASALGGQAKAAASPRIAAAGGAVGGDDAMLAIIALHDVLALMPEAVAVLPAARDRVFTLDKDNVPSWRYCMPITIEQLAANEALSQQLRSLVVAADRLPPSVAVVDESIRND